MKDTVSRIALYARESTKWQAENGYNLEDQKKRMRAYCEACFANDSYTIAHYDEKGASAKSLERPIMEQLIADIDSGKISHLMVYSIDRLSRTIIDLVAFVEFLKQRNVQLISVTEKIDTETPQGRFFLQLLGLLAQLERENISERTRRALLESAKQGNYAKPRWPYGYRKDNISKKLEIVEEEAKVVRGIYRDIISGKSPIAVAKELRAKKIANMAWFDSNVYGIIQNKLYKGVYTTQGEDIPDHTPAIVTAEDWAKANECLVSGRRYTKHLYVFRHHLYCQKCNRLMVGTSCYNRTKQIYIYYKCTNCHLIISEKKLVEEIGNQLTARFRDDIWKTFINNLNNQGISKEKDKLRKYRGSNIAYNLQYGREKKFLADLGITDGKLCEAIRQLKVPLLEADFKAMKDPAKRESIKEKVDRIYVSGNKNIASISYRNKSAKKKSRIPLKETK